MEPSIVAAGETGVMERRRQQRSFGEGLIAGEVSQLREDWMAHAGILLNHERLVSAVFEALCKRHRKSRTRGRLMRLDTTVVETNIHYPADSNLLGDGVRVLTCARNRILAIAGPQGARLRDRTGSVKLRILVRAHRAHQGRTQQGSLAAGL
jgi:hypothetical protein